MSVEDFESELNSLGYVADNVVTIDPRGVAYAVGYLAEEIEEGTVAGYQIIDDPSLVDEQ